MSGDSKAPPLRLLFWESTWRCNLACIHCRRTRRTAAACDELSADEAKLLFDSAAKLGGPVIVFSGGEPLMRDDWPQLAHCARLAGLTTALATNGTMIDEPTADKIRAAGFQRVAVSLDGADARTHDSFRRVEGAFEKALAGLRRLRTLGQPIQINCTVATHNVHQLDEFYDLSRRLGAEALHFFLLVPVGCGTEISATHQLNARRCEELLGRLCDRQLSGELEVRATCAPHYYRVARQRGMPTAARRGCLGGISVAFVAHTGDVFPCGYLPVKCGNVREHDLAEIWQDSAIFQSLRDYSKLKGKCGECEYRSACGGCRARAYAQTGDYLAAEPACCYQPRGRRI
ncbi:MAG: radical SAM protein [Planctomycetota bacterium]